MERLQETANVGSGDKAGALLLVLHAELHVWVA